jgi:hypothetical protein
MTRFITTWRDQEVRIRANFLRESSPIEGIAGRTTGDFQCVPSETMRYAIELKAISAGLDLECSEIRWEISRAVSQMHQR